MPFVGCKRESVCMGFAILVAPKIFRRRSRWMIGKDVNGSFLYKYLKLIEKMEMLGQH